MNFSLFILFLISVFNKRLHAQTENSMTKGLPVNHPNIQRYHIRCSNRKERCDTLHYTNLVSAILNGLRIKNTENQRNTNLTARKRKTFFSDLRNQSAIQARLLQHHVLKPYIVAPRYRNQIGNRSNSPRYQTINSSFSTRRTLSGGNKTGAVEMPPLMAQKLRTHPIHRHHKRNRVYHPLEKSKNSSQYLHFENVKANEINKTVYSYDPNSDNIYNKFLRNLDEMERKYYQVSFEKLIGNAPPGRQENGISFSQSGVLLYLALMAISSEVDTDTKLEIDICLGAEFTVKDKIMIIEKTLSSFPSSTGALKIRWAFRLMLSPNISVTEQFKNETSELVNFHVDHFNGSETPEVLTNILNNKVAIDSGGAMHNTFDEDELSDGVLAVLTSILYVRGQWRTAPTLLNGTTTFRDVTNAPPRTFCSIRINDVMRYAEFHEWDAEGVEISYATPGLTLLLLVPRGNSLKRLAGFVSSSSIREISSRLQTLRAAVTLPLYTLRMTLLLPNKLRAMGMPGLVDKNSTTSSLKLSHAVQRLMFWSEPGRNAFKDDGIEWDAPPEIEILIDRPYIFFVRWHNMTLLNGNFVL